jgi:hypothetical protein
MKSLFTVLLVLLTLGSFAQTKTFLDFRNESVPTYPGCENAVNKEDCYRENVGSLIVQEVNKQYQALPVKAEKFQIKITIYNKATAESTYNVEIDNEKIRELTLSALKNLPLISPITDREGKPVSSTFSFYITLKHNGSTKQYEQAIISTTESMKAKPHPFPMTTARFKDCPQEDKFVTKCFQEKFIDWITTEMGNETSSFKGQKAKIKITVEKDGSVFVHSIKTDYPLLQERLEKALANFPKLEPTLMGTKPVTMTYDLMPITF